MSTKALAEKANGKAALTLLQERFVAEFVVDLNATAAYIRAGGSAKAAYCMAHDLLKKPEIKAAIAEAQRESLARTGLSADMLLLQLLDIATADPRELSELRRTNCRYCWGLDHKYQWTPAEYDRAVGKVEEQNLGRSAARRTPPPVCEGGLCFDRTRDPNPDCPECRGEGYVQEFFHDTRKLAGKAARLFGGVKVGKNGLEFILRSQDRALEVLSKHFGLLKETVEHSGPNGQPIQAVVMNSDQFRAIAKSIADEI